jgi:hypothetical protein
MNSVAQELSSQLYGVGSDSAAVEDVNMFSRLTSTSEKELVMSRLNSTDERLLADQLNFTRASSVDDWRHNHDILMLSQRSSASDSQAYLSRQSSANETSHPFSRASSASESQFSMPRHLNIDDRHISSGQYDNYPISPLTQRKEGHNLSFSSILSPRNKSAMSSINHSISNTPTSRNDRDRDFRDSASNREREKERERERDLDKERERERERMRGKSPSSVSSDAGSRKHSISSLPPLSPTFDFGSRYTLVCDQVTLNRLLAKFSNNPIAVDRTDFPVLLNLFSSANGPAPLTHHMCFLCCILILFAYSRRPFSLFLLLSPHLLFLPPSLLLLYLRTPLPPFRAFRLPIDINLVRAPDTPLTSERVEGKSRLSYCYSRSLYPSTADHHTLHGAPLLSLLTFLSPSSSPSSPSQPPSNH